MSGSSSTLRSSHFRRHEPLTASSMYFSLNTRRTQRLSSPSPFALKVRRGSEPFAAASEPQQFHPQHPDAPFGHMPSPHGSATQLYRAQQQQQLFAHPYSASSSSSTLVPMETEQGRTDGRFYMLECILLRICTFHRLSMQASSSATIPFCLYANFQQDIL